MNVDEQHPEAYSTASGFDVNAISTMARGHEQPIRTPIKQSCLNGELARMRASRVVNDDVSVSD